MNNYPLEELLKEVIRLLKLGNKIPHKKGLVSKETLEEVIDLLIESIPR